MSKDWLTDVQTASKQYKGVAGKGHGQKQKIIRVWDLFLFFSFFLVFPKYSITRSYCKALLTEAYQDLLLPDQDSLPRSSSSPPSPPSLDEAKKTFESVLAMTRRANGYLVEDMKVGVACDCIRDKVNTCTFRLYMYM